MAFTLRLTVHGVLGGVEHTNDDGKTVFTILCCKYEPRERQPAVAFIKFPRSSYQGGRHVGGDGRYPDLGHIVIQGEHLTVDAKAVPKDTALTLNKRKDPISSTPTAYDAESLVWVPNIDDLEKGHGTINSAYFNAAPHAVPALVARLDLTAGRVATTGVERVQVPFSNGNGKSYRRAIAREFRLQMEVEDDEFALRSTPLDGSPRSNNDMKFTATPNRILDIVFGNDSLRAIYDPVPPITPIDVIQQDAAAEYEFYYEMSANPPVGDRTLPLVASRPGGEPFCSPSQFKK